MKKPRIIICDTNREYTMTLVKKFVQEYFDAIDIELVTDEEYFDLFFSNPQTADILVVADSLYSPVIKRHNIGKIFVLTENELSGNTEDLNIFKLYKYTSVNDIFNRIVGESQIGDLSGKSSSHQLILVCSATGGTGKTSIALGISACLQANYKRVLYINTDELQNFQYYLKDKSALSSTEVYAHLGRSGDSAYSEVKGYIRKEGFDYLPPFKAALMSLGLKQSVYCKIAEAAKKSGKYDFVIVDGDSVFDEDKAALMNSADKVLIIMEQTEASVFATGILSSNINGVNSDKYLFVCNKFDDTRQNALTAKKGSAGFTVNEYVERFPEPESMKITELAANRGIQKVAFLVV